MDVWMPDRTSHRIAVSEDLHQQLEDLKDRDETFDDVVARLLEDG